jgi:hypothetical protein
MKSDKAFGEAFKRFSTVDAAAGALSTRLEEAHAKRVQVAIDVAAVDREIEAFTASGDFDTQTASKLVNRQTEASNMLKLLDRSIDHLTRELAASKVEVLRVERDCINAQRNFHATIAESLCREFLRSNADTIQRIVRSCGVVTACDNAQTYGIAQASEMRFHVETLFQTMIPAMAANEFGADDAFREGCRPVDQSPINCLHESANVTPAERSHTRARGETPEVMLTSMHEASAPSDVAPFNRSLKVNAAREAARLAEHHRAQIAIEEERLKRLEQRVGSTLNLQIEAARIKQALAEHAAEADRYDNRVADIDAELEAHRMAA